MVAFRFIQMVLAGKSAAGIVLPAELGNVPVCPVDDGNIEVFLGQLLALQKSRRVLVVTENRNIVELVSALNGNFSCNKVSTLCGGVFDLSALDDEISRNTLRSEGGGQLYPEAAEWSDRVFFCGERVLIKGAENSGERLFSADGTLWGTLLGEEFNAGELRGMYSGLAVELNVAEKAALMLAAMSPDGELLCGIGDVLVFERGGSMLFAAVPDGGQGVQPAMAEMELFLGVSPNERLHVIMDRLASCDLPAALAEDIGETVLSVQTGRKMPDGKVVRNTLERICLR